MKWSILQLLTVSFIVLFMGFLEYISGNRTIQPSPEGWTAVNPWYVTFLVVALVLTGFYLIFLFEVKKENSILERSFWGKMPKICVIVGILSLLLFIVGGTVGPIMTWVEQWRSLLYMCLVYFLFLIFLFTFSLVHKKQRYKQRTEKTIHTSYFWTLLLFFAVYFLF